MKMKNSDVVPIAISIAKKFVWKQKKKTTDEPSPPPPTLVPVPVVFSFFA